MSNENTVVDNETVSTEAGATTGRPAADKWAERFGTIVGLDLKVARNGKPYAVVKLDCSKFQLTATAFRAEAIEALKTVGLGNKVWVKGPMETVTRTGANGGQWNEQTLRVIYAGARGGKKTAAGEAADATTDVAAVADDQVSEQVETAALDDAEGVF